MNARLLTAFAVLAAAAAGCGDTGATASQPAGSAAPKTATFSVTSPLRGKTLVPRRIHWVARTSAAASEVRFLIDGKVRWIENTAPFSYSEEGGYLVTSWLSPVATASPCRPPRSPALAPRKR